MAVTNITKEVEVLRASKQREDRIDNLTQEKAAFVVKALLLAGHVSEHIIDQSLNLAETLK